MINKRLNKETVQKMKLFNKLKENCSLKNIRK